MYFRGCGVRFSAASLGLNEFDFYTVLFGVSRVMGFCVRNISALELGQPIIRFK